MVLPLIWRLSAKQRSRVLLEFAQTELDSAWQSLFALTKVKDPATRALLFEHAFEEMQHYDLFSKQASQKSPDLPTQPTTRREPLMPLENATAKDAVEFLAFLAIGEGEIQKDFQVYEKALPDADMRALFEKICQDEILHAKASDEALSALAKERGVSLRWVRWRHFGSLAYKRYVSIASKFGLLPMTGLLFLVYYLFGPLFFREARARLKEARSLQLQFLREQQQILDESLRSLK
jgi:hypothetical protein